MSTHRRRLASPTDRGATGDRRPRLRDRGDLRGSSLRRPRRLACAVGGARRQRADGAVAAGGIRRRRRHARALHRLRAARGGRLSRGEADHLDGDGGHDDRAPRNAGAASSAGCPGSPRARTGSASPSPSPRPGSNANNLRTTATADRSGGFSVTGEKTYISALESSETMIVVARDAESGGLTLLVLPTPARTSPRPRCTSRSPAFEHQWSVFFDGAVAPGRATCSANPARVAGCCSTASTPSVSSSPRRPSASGAGRSRRRRRMRASGSSSTFRSATHQAVQHPLAESLIGSRGRVGADRGGGAPLRRGRVGRARVEHGEDRRLRRGPRRPPIGRCRCSAAAATPTRR